MPEKRASEEEDGCQVLDQQTYLSRAKAARLRRNPGGPPIAAMYSSLVSGIVTDPELMVLPLDDHAVVRGHAVFDTATLSKGRVYRLGVHLDRLFQTARDARLRLPIGKSEDENRARMTDIVCRTCVASGRRDGNIRYYLSAGPGNFGVSSGGCELAFYCIVHGGATGFSLGAISEVTVRSVPMKPPVLATMKSNNYMLNCLTAMDAQDRGGRFGILIRDDGTVAEGCVANCAAVTADGVLLTPAFGDILRGTTVRRCLELARERLVGEGRPLREVRQETLPLSALESAAELFMLCADAHVFPVTRLDGKLVGNGKIGPVAAELYRLLSEEAERGEHDHIELEY